MTVSPDKSEVICNLPIPIECVSVNVVACEIPYTFNQATDESNDVMINGQKFEFPEGSYNIYQLCDFLKGFIDLKLGVSNWGTITYNRNTQRVIIALDVIFPSLTVINISLINCYRVFGFDASQSTFTLSNDITQGASSVKSSYPPQLRTVNSIFLQSNIVNENCILNGRFSSTLLRIPIDENPSDLITYYGSSDFPIFVNGILHNVKIKIVDENNKPIPINADWMIELFLNR